MNDASIGQLLRDESLPAEAWAVELVRDNLELAFELASQTEPQILPKPKATPLVNAATRILRDAQEFGLADADDLTVVRLIKCRAEFALLVTLEGGPEPRPWLGPCAMNFLDVWKRLTDRRVALNEEGKAVLFVTRCCELIDDDVNESAVLRAIKSFQADDEPSQSERADSYEAWGRSQVGQKWFEIRALEEQLRTRRASTRDADVS